MSFIAARRRWSIVVSALAVALLASGCGGDADTGEATTTAPSMPAACVPPPVEVDLGTGASGSDGGSFDASRAVAVRTPIVPGAMAFDGAGLAGLQSKAEVSPLAAYTLHLSDVVLDRDVLSGRDLGQVEPPTGATLVTLRLVPATETGFGDGDVVVPGDLDYETNAGLVALALDVHRDGDASGSSVTVDGEATILALSDDEICVDFDVTVKGDDGDIVYAAKGAVLAPVLRSQPAYFFT